jgi:hypothetical protein
MFNTADEAEAAFYAVLFFFQYHLMPIAGKPGSLAVN